MIKLFRPMIASTNGLINRYRSLARLMALRLSGLRNA
ncbi:Uncharacterised protein [Salmonella enterica subsp. enterica]|nr:Uncharacterised protein [Salmonella enterica subsp. enterica] [Salmonella enterica subsp. enterica serovar Menston]